MSVRVAECRERYERLATAPDWVRAHGWDYQTALAERTIADIRAKLAVNSSDYVLEVGCGSGAVLNALLDRGQRGVGIDPVGALLEQGGRFGVDRTRIELVRGEAARLPLPDAQFDRVLCYGVFLYFPNLRYAATALGELMRVCKPGGRVLIGDVPGYYERVHACWREYGLRADTLAAVLKLPAFTPLRVALSPLQPLYYGIQRLRGRRESGDEGAYNYLWYGHRFFRRWAARAGYDIEILAQHTQDRPASAVRFDVRLTKPLGNTPPTHPEVST